MLTLTSFDIASARTVKALIERKLKEIEDEIGVTVEVNNFRLSSVNTMLINAAVSVGSEVKMEDTDIGRAFILNAARSGIDKSSLGKVFYERGTGYKIIGWKSGNFKYPVIAERVRDGRTYKFPTMTIRSHFAA